MFRLEQELAYALHERSFGETHREPVERLSFEEAAQVLRVALNAEIEKRRGENEFVPVAAEFHWPRIELPEVVGIRGGSEREIHSCQGKIAAHEPGCEPVEELQHQGERHLLRRAVRIRFERDRARRRARLERYLEVVDDEIQVARVASQSDTQRR